MDDPLAVAGRDVVAARVIRNFDDFPEELIRRLLARARTGRESRRFDCASHASEA